MPISGRSASTWRSTNSGTVSAESGTFNLISGGTISGTASAAARRRPSVRQQLHLLDGAQFAGAGTGAVQQSTTTTLSGTIVNNGNVLINSTGSFTDFILSDDLTITGSGVLTLVNADRIRGSGVLTNASTIQGETSNSGSLGNNESDWSIKATASSTPTRLVSP